MNITGHRAYSLGLCYHLQVTDHYQKKKDRKSPLRHNPSVFFLVSYVMVMSVHKTS